MNPSEFEELRKLMDKVVKDAKDQAGQDLKGVTDWTETHEEETKEVILNSTGLMAFILTSYVEDCPGLLPYTDQLILLMRHIMEFGYYKGRTYTEVPPAFQTE